MASQVAPVFVLSLPRSGSTLVQRVLAADPAVATTAEPWVVLPHLYALRRQGIRAEYDHDTLVTAVDAFAGGLHGGADTYRQETRRMLMRLYGASAGPDIRWFVDKTPRYHLVVPELLELFPTAPVIVLWRNPLAVVASMTASWHEGRWYPDRHGIDLYTGLSNLVEATQRSAGRIVTVRYEDLVSDPGAWAPIESLLSIEIDAATLDRVGNRQLAGPVGDPTQAAYAGISREPLEKWTRELASPVRARWARHYLRWIGDERLAAMGYEAAELHRALDDLSTSVARALPDIWAGVRERVRAGVRRWRDGGAVAHEWSPAAPPFRD